jgi:hypothetical protein
VETIACKIVPFSGLPDSGYSYSAEHQALVGEVEAIIEHWQPTLSWLKAWEITVVPVPENEEDWPLQLATYYFVRKAQLQVKASAGIPEIVRIFPPGEYSLELLVLHELCTLLFERIRQSFIPHCNACGSAVGAAMMEQEEELVSWRVARALLAPAGSSA